MSNRAGAAEVASTQGSKVLHGPDDVAAGYEVRRISSVSKVTGEINRKDPSASGMTTTGDTRSVTTFTVNEAQTYEFRSDQHAHTDSPADTCASVTFTLKRSTTAVFRLTEQTGVGCDTRPDTGAGAGTLRPGSYTLITQTHASLRLAGNYTALRSMSATMTATLRLGSGRVCSNVLRAGGSTITGTRRNDVLCGSSRADVLDGRGGNDLLVGVGGADTLSGGGGADDLWPGGGPDRVDAGEGGDTVRACDNTDDTLAGGDGSDVAYLDPGDTKRGFERTVRC